MEGLSPLFQAIPHCPFQVSQKPPLGTFGSRLNGILARLSLCVCFDLPKHVYCSGCFSSLRSFYCLLIDKLKDVMVDKSLLAMKTCLKLLSESFEAESNS